MVMGIKRTPMRLVVLLAVVLVSCLVTMHTGVQAEQAHQATASPADFKLSDSDVLQYVDPHISTGGFGFGVGGDPVGVQVPFGTMRLSPDGSVGDLWLEFEHYGGYGYKDTDIRCFSHTHMVGPGASDYGNIGVMAARAVPASWEDSYWFKSKFTHDQEVANAGYYAVNLTSHDTQAQLASCGTHTGKHLYTFDVSANTANDGNKATAQPRYIVFDAGQSLSQKRVAVTKSNITIATTPYGAEVRGVALNHGGLTGRNGVGVYIYFYARVEGSVVQQGTFDDAKKMAWGSKAAAGKQVGAVLEISSQTATVTIGISFVSAENAFLNAQMQTNNFQRTFADCVTNAQQAWRNELNLITVNDASAPRDDLITFYTALYHSFLAPTQWSEPNGLYLGMDNNVHNVTTGVVRYTDMSIWDIFRTQIPLLNFLKPSLSLDIAHSLIGMYEEGGDIPRWPIANVYSGCMIANHANIILADMLAKNITGFDIATAYAGMREQATNATRPHIGREGLEQYLTLGYVPSEGHGKSASLTMAYAYDDYALSTFSQYLNIPKDAEYFQNRSKYYEHIWNPSNKYMCPRTINGTFQCHLDPTLHEWLISDAGFCEGDQAEWRWFVPHDLQGLINLFGSKEEYIKHLDEFFANTFLDNSTTLPNPWYWAGNEPDLLEPYQFHAAGRADLSQKYARKIMRQYYTTQPDGVPGNDDFGALSAWYVWSALGFYPLSGTNQIMVGSPLFESVTIHLQNGHTINVTAPQSSDERPYVTAIEVDGVSVDPHTATITHQMLINASTIAFTMSDTPPSAA